MWASVHTIEGDVGGLEAFGVPVAAEVGAPHRLHHHLQGNGWRVTAQAAAGLAGWGVSGRHEEAELWLLVTVQVAHPLAVDQYLSNRTSTSQKTTCKTGIL